MAMPSRLPPTIEPDCWRHFAKKRQLLRVGACAKRWDMTRQPATAGSHPSATAAGGDSLLGAGPAPGSTPGSKRKSTPGSDRNEAYWLWYLVGCFALTFAYLVVLLVTVEQSLWEAASDSLANMVPPAILGLSARPAVKWLRTLRPVALVGAMTGCAVLYALMWYVCLAVTLGLSNLVQGEAFRLVFLGGIGRVWQVYQGMLLFGLLLAFAAFWEAQDALRTVKADLARLEAQANAAAARAIPAETGPVLLRTDEGVRPVEPSEILAIEARDDSSLIILRGQRILTRTALAQWERQLSRSGFLRVHRGWIVNVSAVTSFEPIGEGRMTAFLPGGLTVPVSRTGARLVRDLAA